MSLLEQQNFLARLYTDAALRRAFLLMPEKVGAENGLNEKEVTEIAEIMPEELNFFAESLFWKRLREVEKFLPLTKKVLAGELTEHFREFSQNFNPQTVNKHFEDALEFCRSLSKSKISELSKNVAKFEQKKLEFFGGGQRITICKLDFDIRRIVRQSADSQGESPKRKTKFAVWLRVNRKVKHFFV